MTTPVPGTTAPRNRSVQAVDGHRSTAQPSQAVPPRAGADPRAPAPRRAGRRPAARASVTEGTARRSGHPDRLGKTRWPWGAVDSPLTVIWRAFRAHEWGSLRPSTTARCLPRRRRDHLPASGRREKTQNFPEGRAAAAARVVARAVAPRFLLFSTAHGWHHWRFCTCTAARGRLLGESRRRTGADNMRRRRCRGSRRG